jgi:hypothetical protein
LYRITGMDLVSVFKAVILNRKAALTSESTNLPLIAGVKAIQMLLH